MTSLTPEEGPAWTAVRITARWGLVRRAVEAGHELRVAEGRLLWLLRDGQPRTLREVAEALDLEQSTVNRQVHAALESGVIRRFRADDHPAYLLDISDEGRRRFGADLARQLALHQSALAAIPEAEQEVFLQHLAAYVDTLGEATASRVDDSR